MRPAPLFRNGAVFALAMLLSIVSASLSPVAWFNFGAAADSTRTGFTHLAVVNGVTAQLCALILALVVVTHGVLLAVALQQERTHQRKASQGA